jgi:hypothetical protein
MKSVNFWRLHVLYLFNMIDYPFIAKAVLETIAKPSHMQTSEILGDLYTVFVKLVRVR